MIRLFYFLLFLFLSANNYAWNALGHELIAQIAYDHLNPHVKQVCDQYLHHLDSDNLNFVTVASWLDQIRKNDIHWFDHLHYIDIPFSKNQKKLPPINRVNALWGVNQAITVLSSSKSTPADKGLSLAILIHLMGDIHQPLHTASKVSKPFPLGDKGGNLYYLASNSIGNNLHQYWDNGGGLLKKQNRELSELKKRAYELETKESCKTADIKKTAKEWVKESHEIAIAQAYSIRSHKVPSKNYQLKVQEVTQKQIVFAGCRLAMLLNQVLNDR